ncbi:hypothetical protein D9M68_495410 [compost metagenome]
MVVAHPQLANLLRCDAVCLLGLDVDLVGAAKTVEIVGVHRTQVDLQGVEDVVDRHTVRLGLVPVDVRIELRNIDLIAGEDAS